MDADVSWADGMQAVVSLLAFFALPQGLIKLWNATRYTIRATLTPVDPGVDGSSDTWQLAIENTAHQKMRKLEAVVIPRESGSGIVYATMQGESDGGLQVKTQRLVDGALELEFTRMGPRRIAYFLLKTTTASTILVHGDTHAVRHQIRYTAEQARVYLLATTHMRLAVLLLQFVAAYFILIAHMAYRGISGN